MRYKKIPKTALHALLIITVLTLGAIQESLNFLGGGRPTVRQEAIKQLSSTKTPLKPEQTVKVEGKRISGLIAEEEREDASEERQRMRDLVHLLRSAPPALPLRSSAVLVPENARDGAEPSDASQRPARLAMCFFGQVKNFEDDHGRRFMEHVLHPLMAYYPQIDVYLHTYNIKRFSNPRNGEHNVTIDVVSSLERLVTMLRQMGTPGCVSLKGLNITEPLDADRHFRPLEFYLSRGDPWDNEGISMFNLLRQLYSLDQVTQQWESDKEPNHYTAVVYTRPDLLFHTRLPLVASQNGAGHVLSPNSIYAAPFDDELGQALNDRFAFGTPDVMRIYGHRMRYIEPYFDRYREASLWSEKFLHKVMMEMHGFAYTRLENFLFSRIRADGSYRNTR